jgi:hypothetical protein
MILFGVTIRYLHNKGRELPVASCTGLWTESEDGNTLVASTQPYWKQLTTTVLAKPNPDFISWMRNLKFDVTKNWKFH